MNKQIKKGNLNFDQSGRAYPDNPQIKENWDCIWENDGRYYELIGDTEHKEWEQVKVEVRELSLEERYMLVRKNYLCPKWDFVLDEKGNPVTNPIPQDVWYDNYNIPRRAISLTYNNQTIESYE